MHDNILSYGVPHCSLRFSCKNASKDDHAHLKVLGLVLLRMWAFLSLI